MSKTESKKTVSSFIKSHPLAKIIGLMLLISVVIVFLSFMFLKLYSRHGQEYEVPDFLGKNFHSLNEISGSNHFTFIPIDSIYIPGKEGGEVLTQDPLPNSKVKKGRKIYLTICSSNPDNVTIPNLVDLTLRQAISQLESLGLQGGKLTFVSDIANNAILKQSHKGKAIVAGTQLPRGSYIDLVVGKGENATGTSVPLVIGKTAFYARKEILAMGLNVGKEIFENNADKTTAKVYMQSPNSSGTRKNTGLGTSINLWYAAPDKKDFSRLAKTASSEAQKATDSVDEENDSDASSGNQW